MWTSLTHTDHFSLLWEFETGKICSNVTEQKNQSVYDYARLMCGLFMHKNFTTMQYT